jgi:excisionase family DNA binding protein
MTAQNQSMPPLLTVVEVARYLRVHPATIYRLLSKRTIPAFRVAGEWRFRPAEIARWQREQQGGH